MAWTKCLGLMKNRFTFLPQLEKGDGLLQGDGPCILLSGGGLGFREDIDMENLERMGLGQFGRDFGVPA